MSRKFYSLISRLFEREERSEIRLVELFERIVSSSF